LKENAEHFDRDDRPTPGIAGSRFRQIERRGLGDDLKLVPERERIELTHVLIEIHPDSLAFGLHARLHVAQDHRIGERL